MSFGGIIRQLRTNKGLTLKELGERCEPPLDTAYLSRIENDKIGVGPEMAARLGKALGVSADFLNQLAQPDEKDLAVVFFTKFMADLFSKADKQNWIDAANNINWEGSDEWEAVIPRFREDERIPSPLRMKVINKILSLEPDEVQFVDEVLELYKRHKLKVK